MERKSVNITGPVSSYVLYDKRTDRYFHLFGDVHYSLDGSCSQLDRHMKCNRPDFTYSKTVYTGTSCWTISALLHEIFLKAEEKGLSVDFYIEKPIQSENVITASNSEMIYRREGIYSQPRSQVELQEVKERLDKISFGWIDDIMNMLYKKKYASSVRIISADARQYKDQPIVPILASNEVRDLKNQLHDAVNSYLMQHDIAQFRFKMNEIIKSIDEIIVLGENFIRDPYLFLRHFMVPFDFVKATNQVIEYIPVESEIGKKVVTCLYYSINNQFGVGCRDEILVAPSADSWRRLELKVKETADKIEAYTQDYLQRVVSEYQFLVEDLSAVLNVFDFTEPENIEELINVIPQITSVLDSTIKFTSSVMDRYVLSETFRSEAKHNIYFAGNAHIENYVEFLTQYMGFELLESVEKKSTDEGPVRCVYSSYVEQLI